MAEITTVNVPTNTASGATRVTEHGAPTSSEAPEVTDARRGGKIVGLPGLPTQTLQIGGKRSLSDAARERIAKLTEDRQTKAAAASSAARPAAAPAPAEPAAPAPKPVVTIAIDPRAGGASSATRPVQPAGELEDLEDDNTDPDAPAAKPGKLASAKAAAASAVPDELADARATIARQTQLLEQRRQDLETAGKPRDAAHTARVQRLRDVEDSYVTDPVTALRGFVAAAIGAKDDKDPRIDSELDDLLSDLTASRMSVPMDTAHQAKRKSTLTQLAWELDKQRRSAKEQDADSQRTHTEQASKTAAAQRVISDSLGASKERYPNLHLAPLMDGKRPEQAVWQALESGFQSGHLDPKDSDEANIAKAASVVERFYQGRAESLRAALNPGTADQKTPPAEQASGTPGVVKSEQSRRGHGPRTLTTTDVSVAPVSTDQPPAVETRPQFKSDAERRAYVIRKNFPDHPAARKAR